MIQKALNYFFPRRKPRELIPLLPRRYSGQFSPYGKPDEKLRHEINILKSHALASTDADALRLMRRYKGKSLQEIITLTGRKRRYLGRIKMFIKRFKRAW